LEAQKRASSAKVPTQALSGAKGKAFSARRREAAAMCSPVA
jgi:hypothetical protein